MKIAVIILNYNSSDDCRKCVSYLKRQEGVDLEIVIVDNCSPDVDKVKRLCQEEGCTFIANSENRGYNAGNNVGLRYSASKGYKYALIANPDMEFPQTDYVYSLLKIMENNDDIVVCGGNIISLNGERQSPKRFTTYFEEAFWFITGFCKLFNKNMTYILPPRNQFCDILMGSCILVRIDFMQHIGFFDENIFLFCEEPILGKQVKLANKKMYYLQDKFAVHAHEEKSKGSLIYRHKIYWKSRWYFLTHYSNYSNIELSIMWLSKKILYLYKYIYFKINKIK